MIDITPLMSPTSVGIVSLVEYLIRGPRKSAKSPKGQGPQNVPTPQPFFDWLNLGLSPKIEPGRAGYGFVHDLSALPENAKCERFYSPEQNSLIQPWHEVCGERTFWDPVTGEKQTWCDWAWNNPPYGNDSAKFVGKAAVEVDLGARLLQLLKAAVGTRWFNKYVKDMNCHVIVLEGRIPFPGYAGDSANFDSMLIEWNGRPFEITFLDWKDVLGAWLEGQGLPVWPPKREKKARAKR